MEVQGAMGTGELYHFVPVIVSLGGLALSHITMITGCSK